MGMGMIGAIGGIGKGLNQESEYLAKQDDANADVARKKDLQGWLMQQQEQYQIRTEQRTDVRAEQQKDRDFSRTQTEAPVRRDIKVGDEKASAKGKSDVAAETADQDAAVAAKQAVAKETPSDKAVKEGHAGYYKKAGDALEAKADAKLDPTDAAELKGVQGSITEKQKLIDKQMAEPGGWDPAKNPGQKALQSQLVGLQLRERTILQKARGGDGATPAADPLGLRKQPGGGAAPAAPAASGASAPKKGGMLQQPGDADQRAIYEGEYRKAQQALAAAKTPDEQGRAQTDITSLTREMQRLGIQPPGAAAPTVAATPPAMPAPPRPAATPVAAVAAPADPTEAMGQELDASRAAYKALTEPSKRPGLAAGVPVREEYAAKVQTLRDKIRMQERRYADAVGNKGAAFATARP